MQIADIPAIYINLDRDVDRRHSTEAALKNLGFEKIIRSPGILREPYWVGCAAAHYVALGIIDPPFIIFEDDVQTLNKYDAISVPEKADAIYLGVSKWARIDGYDSFLLRYKKETENLYRIYNMLSAHAILYLSQTYVAACRAIAEQSAHEYGIHWDRGLAEVQRFFKVYALDRPMVFQKSNEADTILNLTAYERYKDFENINALHHHPTIFPDEAQPEH
jgi:hypothetical protein